MDTGPAFGVYYMAGYDASFKLAAVQEYLSGPGGFRAFTPEYGVDQATIRRWIDNYCQHGDAGLDKKFSHYSAWFKLSVLKQM